MIKYYDSKADGSGEKKELASLSNLGDRLKKGAENVADAAKAVGEFVNEATEGTSSAKVSSLENKIKNVEKVVSNVSKIAGIEQDKKAPETKQKKTEKKSEKKTKKKTNKKPTEVISLGSLQQPDQQRGRLGAVAGLAGGASMPIAVAKNENLANWIATNQANFDNLKSMLRDMVSGQQGVQLPINELVSQFKEAMPTLNDQEIKEMILKKPEMLDKPLLPKNQERAITQMAMGMLGEVFASAAPKTTPVATAGPLATATIEAAQGIEMRNAQHQAMVTETIKYNNQMLDVAAKNAQAYFNQMTNIESRVVSDAINTFNIATSNILQSMGLEKSVAAQRDANEISKANGLNTAYANRAQLQISKANSLLGMMKYDQALRANSLDSVWKKQDYANMMVGNWGSGVDQTTLSNFFSKADQYANWKDTATNIASQQYEASIRKAFDDIKGGDWNPFTDDDKLATNFINAVGFAAMLGRAVDVEKMKDVIGEDAPVSVDIKNMLVQYDNQKTANAFTIKATGSQADFLNRRLAIMSHIKTKYAKEFDKATAQGIDPMSVMDAKDKNTLMALNSSLANEGLLLSNYSQRAAEKGFFNFLVRNGAENYKATIVQTGDSDDRVTEKGFVPAGGR